MPIQVIQQRDRQAKQPSAAARFAAGLAQGSLEAVPEYFRNKNNKAQIDQSNETYRRLTGQDLSGLDPQSQQKIAAELLKQEGKQNIFGQKQSFLDKLIGSSDLKEKNNENGNQNQYNPLNISDNDIIKASSIDPVLGRELRLAKDAAIKQKQHEEQIDFSKQRLERSEAKEITTPLFKELSSVRKNIPLQEQAILDIKEASPKVSGLDYFADVTGFEPLRSSEGAKLKTGIKDFFLSDLTRAGARPNQWIEQQLADALPKIGRSAEANLITSEGLQFKVDLAKKRLEIIDRLSESDRDQYGFVKANVESRTDKEMKKYVVDRQKELQDNIKKIKSSNKGNKNVVRMTSPDGSIYEIQSDDIDEAIRNDFNFAE